MSKTKKAANARQHTDTTDSATQSHMDLVADYELLKFIRVTSFSRLLGDGYTRIDLDEFEL